MSKTKAIILAIFVLFFIFFAVRFLSGEDDWICAENGWIMHGKPLSPRPDKPCGKSEQVDIVVYSPQANSAIISPVLVKGEARGNWFFEAVFPIIILDKNGKEIGRGLAQAQSDWMTENFVEFKSEINSKVDNEGSGMVVFKNDNPSGIPENDKKIEIPVYLKSK